MTNHDIVQDALDAHQKRTDRRNAAAEQHQSEQSRLREALVATSKSGWSAHAAFILYDENRPTRVPVTWEVSAATARQWDLTDVGSRVIANPVDPDVRTPFIVTGQITDGISLLIELSPPDLEPINGSLAVRDNNRKGDGIQVNSLADLGEAIEKIQGNGR